MRVVLIVIAIAGAAVLYPGYVRLRHYRQEAARLEERERTLRERNAELAAKVERMKTEGLSAERIARELGMVRDGEIIYDVVESDEEDGPR